MLIEHLSSPGCPNAFTSRRLLDECLRAMGITDSVEEHVGEFPSPTVRIDGIDVMHPVQPPSGNCCRLDVPTRVAIMAALQQALDQAGGGQTIS